MNKNQFKKTFFICNPAAGAGLADSRWKTLYNELAEHNIDYDYQFTTAPKDATAIAKKVLDSGDGRIAVFGGDGTMNEVLQGIINDDKQPQGLELIFIPAGSSCDFAKNNRNSKSNIELIQSTDLISIDIVKIESNDRNGNYTKSYFFNNSSIGVISAAGETYNNVTGIMKQIKRWSVDASAILAGLQAIIKFKPINCEMQFDDEEAYFSGITNITVFKTAYFGGGMHYNVETVQDDGNFNVVIVESTSKLKFFGMITALYAGTLLKKKEAHHRTCKALKFDTNRNYYIEMDGESAGYPPAKYSILKQAVDIVI